MKYVLLVALCLFSFIVCFSIASPLHIALSLISLIVWLILSHKDAAQIMAFRIICIVMLVVIGVPVIGGLMDGKQVEIVHIFYLFLYAVGLIGSSVKIHRALSAAKKE